ncbi:hypothetical protein HPB49_001371 [Dermacentor silvarum]|uniref:Uncharacterized protein n=1 Tax=Dermacentor silvarum TaxID=543639 RepID=A0ACB8CUK8_DERSI|nr:hypothetical protein HPB49_001371 [Dermacentor silvarum]
MLESLKVDITALQVLLRAPDPTSQLRAAITLSLTLGVHGSTLAQKLGEANHTTATERYLAQLYPEASRLLTSRESAGASPRLEDVLELDRRLGSLLSKGGTELLFPVAVLGSLSDRLSTHGWIRLLNEHLSPHDRLGYQDYVSVDSYDDLRDAIRFLFGGFEGLHEVAYYICLHVLVGALRLDYQRRQQQQVLAASKSAAESVVRTCVQVTQASLQAALERIPGMIAAQMPNSASRSRKSPIIKRVSTADTHNNVPRLHSQSEEIYEGQITPLVENAGNLEPAGSLILPNGLPNLTLPLHLTTLTDMPAVVALQEPGDDATLTNFKVYQRDAQTATCVFQNFTATPVDLYCNTVYSYAMVTLLLLRKQDPSLHILDIYSSPKLPNVTYADIFSKALRVANKEPLVVGDFLDSLLDFLTLLDLFGVYDPYFEVLPCRVKVNVRIPNDNLPFPDRFEQCLRSLWLSKTNETLAPSSAEADGRGAPGTYGAGELLFWTQGARLAFAGLKEALSGFHRDTNWPSYWRRAQKSFFRRFCLLRCSASKPSSRLRCLLPLANMVEFAEAFECPADTAPKGATGSHCSLQ